MAVASLTIHAQKRIEQFEKVLRSIHVIFTITIIRYFDLRTMIMLL